MNALGRKQKTDKPHLFYEAIPKRFFKDYKKLFKFQDLITTGDLKKQKKPATEPQPNIMDFKNKKSIAAQPTQKSNSNSGDPKLQYPNERATHTYKSPNKR